MINTQSIARLLFPVFCLALYACNSSPVDKIDNGIIIHLKTVETHPGKAIRLQVINNDIIRVSASSDDKFPATPSRIAAYSETLEKDWSYSETENDVILKTVTLNVTVSLLTGSIVFSGNNGNVLLEEKAGGEKSFEETEVFYGMQPFIVSNKNYGLLEDTNEYYFVRGNSMDDVISGYRTITGKAQVMPKWAMGFWQSRASYQTQAELLNVLQEFRERQIPVDNIVLDGAYASENAGESYDFDLERFPDATMMIEEIHDLDARFMITVSVQDTSNEDSRKNNWEQISKKLYYRGIDAWCLNAPETDIRTNVQAIYEGQRAANNYHRIFLLAQSNVAGLQRYATAVCSEKSDAHWENMKAQIAAGLNYSIAGNPYWTMDTGGLSVEKRYENAAENSKDREEWRELNVRWHQFGTFTPLFRSHGQSPYRELWHIAPEEHPAYGAMLYYTHLRYRLMPYIYTLAARTHFDDYTIMRPLVMDFASDSQVLQISNQYLFGPGLMVCPVHENKARSREVYFPAGAGWYNLYSGEYIEGGQPVTVDAPYHRIPLYATAGAILPMGETIQHTKQNQRDLTIFVYEGQDGAFTLYEDEGTNYNYEKGVYSRIPIIYNDENKTLTIGERQGEYPRMHKIRHFRMVRVGKEQPVGLDDEIVGTTVIYNGREQTVLLESVESEEAILN